MKDLSAILITPDTPILKGIEIIDKGSAQIALVVDPQRHLLGTLTDGDIRRGLLSGKKLDTPVQRIMNRNFRSLRNGSNELEALEMMKSEKISQLPVLDNEGIVKELLILQEIISPTNLPNPVVIMAGGKGTRLRPHTENCPKPMLPIGDKPILEILLKRCIASGFSEFFFSINYLKEQIIEHFKDGSKWGVNISYLEEDEPLGTAGSLKLLPKSLKEPILVLNGDVLTHLNPTQLLRFHSEHEADATICVREHEVVIPFGVVQANGLELSKFEEKPCYKNFVNAGVYMINPKLISIIPRTGKVDMPWLLESAQRQNHRVTVYPIHEYWIDVGRPESFIQANEEWRNKSL